MQSELLPGEQLEQLVKRPGAAGERDHRVGQLGHQRFALVHGLDDVEFGQTGVGDLVLDQAPRDHADHGAAGGQRAIGERPHQPDARAAVDDLEAARASSRPSSEAAAA